jgi:hypothetical protein
VRTQPLPFRVPTATTPHQQQQQQPVTAPAQPQLAAITAAPPPSTTPPPPAAQSPAPAMAPAVAPAAPSSPILTNLLHRKSPVPDKAPDQVGFASSLALLEALALFGSVFPLCHVCVVMECALFLRCGPRPRCCPHRSRTACKPQAAITLGIC